MSNIHPAAVIAPEAEIDPSATVGPYTVIEADVSIGAECRIGSNVFIGKGTVLGRKNEIHQSVALGDSPQHRGFKDQEGRLVIGDGNVFREFVTVHRAFHEGGETRIGSNNYMMVGSHAGHDCVLGDGITVANYAQLSGHVVIEDGVFLSAFATVHQFIRIGKISFIRPHTKIGKNPPPYFIATGESEVAGVNIEGLKRAGFSSEDRSLIQRAFRLLYRSGLSLADAVSQIRALSDGVHLSHLADFIENSDRGICRYQKRGQAPFLNQ